MADAPPRLLLSSRHPVLYALAVRAYQLHRHVRWLLDDLSGVPIANMQTDQRLPLRVKRHQSRLLRQLGDSEMWLRHNKVKNLALAIAPIDGLLIRPREMFSFWRRVRRPTGERGLIDGMEISRGEALPIGCSYRLIPMSSARRGGGATDRAWSANAGCIHSPMTAACNERQHHLSLLAGLGADTWSLRFCVGAT